MRSLSPLALAPSDIRHRRFHPKAHAFDYTLNYVWFDADQLENLCAPAWSWSAKGWNVLTLKADDFLTGYDGASIRAKVVQVLQQKAQFQLDAAVQIRVLALPRCLGKRFNSVVFYYIYAEAHPLEPAENSDASSATSTTSQTSTKTSTQSATQIRSPEWIISEITNTPWDERIAYVHDCRGQVQPHGGYLGAKFEFDKAFHVSPFMPMNLQYCWHFHWSNQQHFIHMQLFENNKLKFDASMNFVLQPITQTSQQNLYALQYMLQPFKMLSAIYWQALRLWFKRIPFFPHPRKNKG